MKIEVRIGITRKQSYDTTNVVYASIDHEVVDDMADPAKLKALVNDCVSDARRRVGEQLDERQQIVDATKAAYDNA